MHCVIFLESRLHVLGSLVIIAALENKDSGKLLCPCLTINQTEQFIVVLIQFHAAVVFCKVLNVFLIFIPEDRHVFINGKMRNQQAVFMDCSYFKF